MEFVPDQDQVAAVGEVPGAVADSQRPPATLNIGPTSGIIMLHPSGCCTRLGVLGFGVVFA